MITLFENITDDLTTLERETLVPMFIDLLKQSNESTRFTGKQIRTWFNSQSYNLTQIRLCKIVAYCRVRNLFSPFVLIGAGNGYFLTNNTETVSDQIESLEGRVDALNCVIDSLKAQKLSLVNLNKCR